MRIYSKMKLFKFQKASNISVMISALLKWISNCIVYKLNYGVKRNQYCGKNKT